jgi:hypothetical protein
MTAARHQEKPGLGLALGLFGAVALACGAADGARAGDRVVIDWRNGLALAGFDPVAYFTDRDAVLGRPELESTIRNTFWRFRNPGNQAEFTAHPDVYGPQFGGYDPVAAARGVAVPGNPRIWHIARQRLYLFFDQNSRDAFAADPAAAAAAAEARWPKVVRTLVP